MLLPRPAAIPKFWVFEIFPEDVNETEPVAEILFRIKSRLLGTVVLLVSAMSPNHRAEMSPETVMAFRDRVFVEPVSP